jgi:2-keto-3-deoxy-L-fuconate dehydrogenase
MLTQRKIKWKRINPMTLFSLQNKTAVVTGGGSGIGRSISELFAQQGAKVAIIELNLSSGEEVAQRILSQGGQAKVYEANVAVQHQIKEVFTKINQDFGGLDILVNNAGIAHVGTVETTTEEDFDKVYAVNVKGVYNCMQAAIGWMKNQGGGVILNMASIASSIGLPDRFAYTMSKGAVLAMTYSVARDYVKQNIRCNCIAPARVHTPFVDGFLAKNYPEKEQEMFEKLSQSQPIGRMGKPDEIAQLALYLCSEEASFITGSNFPIDGGFVTLNT